MTRRFLLVLALSLAALGCGSPVVVQTAYDRGASFSAYRTFAMLEPNRPVQSGVDVDPFTLQRYRQLAFAHLEARGFRPVAREQADLVVAVLAASRERVEVYNRGYPGYSGYGYAYGGPAFAYDVRTYREGTIVIDLIDRAKNAVVWRGTGQREVSRTLGDAEKREMIDEILRRFPPGSADKAGS